MDCKWTRDRLLLIEVAPSSSEIFSEDEAPHHEYMSWRIGSPIVLRVYTFCVCSAILAAKSNYFRELFLKGKEALEQEHITVRIKDSEEAAFTELVNFMHNDTLSSTSAPDLLNVLMLADKFEVRSCIKRCCSILLSNITITTELAVLYLELCSLISLAEEVHPLTDAAKQFLRSRYKNITEFKDEVIVSFPLSAIEAILSADDLRLTSEDDLFDFILKWANINYPQLEKRRAIIGCRLIIYIRFSHMTNEKLLEVLKCTDLDQDLAFKTVQNALFFKLDALFAKVSLLQNFTRIETDNFLSLPTD